MRFIKTDIIMGILLLLLAPTVVLAQSSSTNYSIDEYFIGPGGETDLNSASYNARASLGDTGVGNSGSANYQLYGGFTTTDEPYLELAVTATNIDMGVLDSVTTGYGDASFSVRTYLAEGYVISSAGTLPTSESGNVIPAKSVKGAPIQGTEEFGMNLATNTVPAAFGANPVQVPDATFSFGFVDDDYNDSDLFLYIEGDTIAQSNSSTGQTDYTVSYIMNVSGITEAGFYQAFQTVVATSTF